jgi:hypothetical protein
MALTPKQLAALEDMTVEDVRRQLSYAGPGMGACVPGVADNMALRGDVLEYLRKRERNTARAHWWKTTGLALILGTIAIGVTIVVALTR